MHRTYSVHACQMFLWGKRILKLVTCFRSISTLASCERPVMCRTPSMFRAQYVRTITLALPQRHSALTVG